ncbi:MAG: V0D/AC39 family V-type ATPase subunit, partial [bacterium]
MELLERTEDRGYPTEYLLTRIRSKRSQLIRDWKSMLLDIGSLENVSSGRYRGLALEKTPEGIWRRLIREYRWVYSQMNGELREIFRPFFVYSELRTLFICLRHAEDRTAGRLDELLSLSLLSQSLKAVLMKSEDIPTAVDGIERIFRSLSENFSGLREILDDEGLRGVEQRITERYLVHTMNTNLHPLMKRFFIRIIDSRNILKLYKHLKLNMKAPAVFTPGGSIAEERMRDILDAGDLFAVGPLIQRFTGVRIDAMETARVENALYRAITRFLKQEGRDPLGIGPILDYLWRCSIETMNLGILLHGRELERDLVS